MEIEEFLNETDNMKIESNVIYHKDDTTRLYQIIHYNNMNNIKKMANKINDNEKKLKNIENYCKGISLFLIVYSITNFFF